LTKLKFQNNDVYGVRSTSCATYRTSTDRADSRLYILQLASLKNPGPVATSSYITPKI